MFTGPLQLVPNLSQINSFHILRFSVRSILIFSFHPHLLHFPTKTVSAFFSAISLILSLFKN